MKVWQHDPPEPLRYFVESRSEPETPHLVDLLEFRCDCKDWQFRVQPKPTTESPCDHVEAALREFGIQELERIRERVKPYTGP